MARELWGWAKIFPLVWWEDLPTCVQGSKFGQNSTWCQNPAHSTVDILQYIVKENHHENYLDDINPDEDEGSKNVDDEKNGEDEGDDEGGDDNDVDDDGAEKSSDDEGDDEDNDEDNNDDDDDEKCGWPALESVAWHPNWLSSASLMDDPVIIAIIQIIIIIANIIVAIAIMTTYRAHTIHVTRDWWPRPF